MSGLTDEEYRKMFHYEKPAEAFVKPSNLEQQIRELLERALYVDAGFSLIDTRKLARELCDSNGACCPMVASKKMVKGAQAMTQHALVTAQLRDIGDVLRSTNLIRGRQIHQLADDLDQALADAERKARLDEQFHEIPMPKPGEEKQSYCKRLIESRRERIAALSGEAGEGEGGK